MLRLNDSVNAGLMPENKFSSMIRVGDVLVENRLDVLEMQRATGRAHHRFFVVVEQQPLGDGYKLLRTKPCTHEDILAQHSFSHLLPGDSTFIEVTGIKTPQRSEGEVYSLSATYSLYCRLSFLTFSVTLSVSRLCPCGSPTGRSLALTTRGDFLP